jgi:hypothetical protein
MGKKVNSNKLTFVAFEPRNGRFLALLSVEGLIFGEKDPDLILQDAAKIYGDSILKLRSLIREINAVRIARKNISARKIWEIGDVIFVLKDRLEKISLQIDNIYSHLVRELGVKRKWLEKVVTFRRYIPSKELIPKSLNWGRCEKGTRRVAERLRDGLLLI